MIPIPRHFQEFIQLLNSHRVRYLIVGGYAVAYHGYPRYTGDIDVFVEISARNAEALAKVLQDFGLLGKDVPARPFLYRGTIVRMGRHPLRLEVINNIAGVTFAECYRRRVRATWDGLPINFISLPDLIANKKASGRNKDLADLDYLPKVPARKKSAPRKKGGRGR